MKMLRSAVCAVPSMALGASGVVYRGVTLGCVAMAMACTAFGDSIRVNVPEGRRACGEETAFEIALLDGKGQFGHLIAADVVEGQ